MCSRTPETYIKELTQEFTFSEITAGNSVKLAAPYIAKPLAKIFNESLLAGIFPSDWKEAKVIPVYKSGTKSSKQITENTK